MSDTATTRRPVGKALYALAGIALVVALAVGSGLHFGSGAPDAQQRIAQIEADVKCPSCEDLSVADSSAPSAVEIRSIITSDVHSGLSDEQIEGFLVGRYGSSILLSPSTHGAVAAVWLVPLVVGIGALCGLSYFFYRRRRAWRAPGAEVPSVRSSDGLSLEALEEKRSMVAGSIDDLRREHQAGDLTDADFDELTERYRSVAVAVAGAIDERQGHDEHAGAQTDELAPIGGRGARRRRHRWLLVGGLCAMFAAVLVLVLGAVVTNRSPGQTATGSPTLARSEQVREEMSAAETLDSAGDIADALELYDEVLQIEPRQPEALAESGWIAFESGVKGKSASLLRTGQQAEEAAVRVAPRAWAPRLYLASMYVTENDAQDSASQFRSFLADKPPVSKVRAAMPVLTEAFARADEALPTLPAGVTASKG